MFSMCFNWFLNNNAVLYGGFENEKKKDKNNFDLLEQGFEPQIFSTFVTFHCRCYDVFKKFQTLFLPIKTWKKRPLKFLIIGQFIFSIANRLKTSQNYIFCSIKKCLLFTSHSVYVGTLTELYRVKIDGLLPRNFL